MGRVPSLPQSTQTVGINPLKTIDPVSGGLGRAGGKWPEIALIRPRKEHARFVNYSHHETRLMGASNDRSCSFQCF